MPWNRVLCIADKVHAFEILCKCPHRGRGARAKNLQSSITAQQKETLDTLDNHHQNLRSQESRVQNLRILGWNISFRHLFRAGSNVGSARRWHPFTWRGPDCFATNSDSYVAACLCSLQILQVVFKPSRVVEQIPTEPVVEPVVPMGSMGPWVSSKSCSSERCLKAHGRIVLVDSLMSEVLWHIMAPCRFNLGIFCEFRLGSSAKRNSPQWTNTSFAHDSAVPKGCSCNMKPEGMSCSCMPI